MNSLTDTAECWAITVNTATQTVAESYELVIGAKHSPCRLGEAHYIAPSAPFHRRACCKRYVSALAQ
jgi:hypothetical protein